MAEPESVNEAAILKALSEVPDPTGGGSIVTRGRVRDVRICGGSVAFDLLAPDLPTEARQRLEEQCRAALRGVPGVSAVQVRFPAPAAAAAPPSAGELLPGVRHVIAVGSGKGGVGKSTVAANLAVSLALDGARVGLLDADVYGPSIPMMMGIREQPRVEAGKMVPLRQYDVALMSLGFLMPDDSSRAVIWRGPMVASAVRQMLADCDWGELDYLLVDLPPGTGDAQLTLAQSVPLTGAVVVMTSQDVAVNIASKAIGMFQRLNVPILGVVGNMDTFACPHCGTQTSIFTRGGSEEAARRLRVPFLGSIPLDPAAVEHGDRGTPTVVAEPDSAAAAAFRQVARNLAERVREAETEEAAYQDALGGLLGRFQSR